MKQMLMEGLALAIHGRTVAFPPGVLVDDVNGKTHYLGAYKTVEDAAIARYRAQEDFGFALDHGEQRPR